MGKDHTFVLLPNQPGGSCRHYLLPLSAPGRGSNGIQSKVLSQPQPRAMAQTGECELQSAVRAVGWKLCSCDYCRPDLALFLGRTTEKGKVSPDPSSCRSRGGGLGVRGKGDLQNQGADFTTSRGFFARARQ